MTKFFSNTEDLSDIISDISKGELQLPNFQRDWVWDEDHIRSLLVSVASSLPIGAVMLLENSDESGGVKFGTHPIKGVEIKGELPKPSYLILDGQQRLTSLTQALSLEDPVKYESRGKPTSVYFYIDINTAIKEQTLENAIITVGKDKKRKASIGQSEIDLSSPELEYDSLMFPCNKVFKESTWQLGLLTNARDKITIYTQFKEQFLDAFGKYKLPIIILKKTTTPEAVCYVFEHVNSGGVKLTGFELLTAMYAGKGFNLRNDWKEKSAKIHDCPALKDLTPTDFLQGVSLISSKSRRGTKVTSKMKDILKLEKEEYEKWAKKVSEGFIESAVFLNQLEINEVIELPYRSQIIPLAAVFAGLEIKVEKMKRPIAEKLKQWYWSGVFGEHYTRSSDTKIANDVEDLYDWLKGGTKLPRTISNAIFHSDRLLTLTSRTSAAYKGLSVLVRGKDILFSPATHKLRRAGAKLDIHHIFPRKWCKQCKIDPSRYDSIINKTVISATANQIIGGKAPSKYLPEMMRKAEVGPGEMDDILRSHHIEPEFLRNDDFDRFFEVRKESLCKLIEDAMKKDVQHGSEDDPETPKPAVPSPADRTKPDGSLKHTATIFGNTKTYNNATLAYVAAWNALIERKSDLCENLRHDTRFTKTEWCFVKSAEEAKQNPAKKAFYNTLANGWLVSTNLSIKVKRTRLRKATRIAGYSFGKGKDIDY